MGADSGSARDRGGGEEHAAGEADARDHSADGDDMPLASPRAPRCVARVRQRVSLRRGQVTEDRRRLQPVAIGNRWIARNQRPGVHGIGNARLRRCDDAFSERQVAGDADLSSEHHVVFNDRAAGDANLRGEQHAHRRARRARSAPGCRSSCPCGCVSHPPPDDRWPYSQSHVVLMTTAACCGIFRCVPSA